MFHLRFLWFMLFYVVCCYCRKDFTALGRHQWRCRKRMPVNSGPNTTINTTLPNDKDPADVVELIKCCCGKACKGVKGLKMHQRRCRVLEGLDENPLGCEHSNSDTTSLNLPNMHLYLLNGHQWKWIMNQLSLIFSRIHSRS